MEDSKKTNKAADERAVKGAAVNTTSSTDSSKGKGSNGLQPKDEGKAIVSESSAAVRGSAADMIIEDSKSADASMDENLNGEGTQYASTEKGTSAEAKDYGIEFTSMDEIKRQTTELEKRPAHNEKGFWSKVWAYIKKRKGRIIFLIILALAIWLGIEYAGYNMMEMMKDSGSKTQYGDIERMDIANSISTTGNVQSKDSRSVTSPLSGVKIAKVNFEVGDMVNEGDVIVEFSREDIQDALDQASEDLAEARASQAIADQYRASDHSMDQTASIYSTSRNAMSAEQSLLNLNQAKQSLDQANKDKSDFIEKYNTAVNNLPYVQQQLEDAQARYSLFQATENAGILKSGTFWTNPLGDDMNTESQIIDFMGYQYSSLEFQNYISDLQTKVSEYKSTINSYDNQITSYEKSIIAAQKSVDSASLSYESALLNQQDSNNSVAKNLNSSDYNYASYLITSGDNVTKAERNLKSQQDKLDDYVVYAPITGIVTSVSAQEGNGYVNTSGGLMTIQAIDTYEITTQIDEYDINNVQLGQKVIIMTDATGDDELEGEVSFISPVSTSSGSSSTSSAASSSSGSSSTYEVRINILSTDPRIKLGMSAKINIVVDEHKQVLVVPYNAINEAEDGQKYIMIVSGSNKKPDKNGDSISVVAADGTVTSVPSRSPKDGDKNEHKDGKDASEEDSTANKVKDFIKYLFTSKEDREAEANESDISSALKRTYVDIGIEGDYYTEIEATGIHEGDEVVLTEDEDNSFNPFDMYGPGF